MEYIYHYESPLGRISLLSDGNSLTGLWFDESSRHRPKISGEREEKYLPVFGETVKWLDIYFSGKDPGFTPSLKPQGSPFRKAVCEIMLTIPYGKTMSYGEIAKRIAKERGLKKMSAQAVGGAVGGNSISLIVPCHRVIGANGSLVGYGGGLDRKIKLLKLEGVDMSGMYVPKRGTAL